MSEIKLSGMQKLTTTFSPFILVRPCKVFLTDLKVYELCCLDFQKHFFFLFAMSWAKLQPQWSGERGEDAISAPYMKNIF